MGFVPAIKKEVISKLKTVYQIGRFNINPKSVRNTKIFVKERREPAQSSHYISIPRRNKSNKKKILGQLKEVYKNE